MRHWHQLCRPPGRQDCSQSTRNNKMETAKRQFFAKGNYFRLLGTPTPPFRHFVYPVPVPGGLISFTLVHVCLLCVFVWKSKAKARTSLARAPVIVVDFVLVSSANGRRNMVPKKRWKPEVMPFSFLATPPK